MSAVMSELSEKKVCHRPSGSLLFVESIVHVQIEGFKLHVTHIVRPFTSRIRYTPEVAGKLERMTKDLANVKRLASLLEEEAAALRALPASGVASDENKVSGEDHVMTDASANEPPEPEESGSQAVEKRIEKVISDQGLVDTRDEKVYETKKVLVFPHAQYVNILIRFFLDHGRTGFISGLHSCCVPHMLLLHHCLRSS
jgi:hypothetical protein